MKLLAYFFNNEKLGDICYAETTDKFGIQGTLIARYDEDSLFMLKNWEELEVFDSIEKDYIPKMKAGYIRGNGIGRSGIELNDESFELLQTLSSLQKDGNGTVYRFQHIINNNEETYRELRKIPYKKFDEIFLYD